MYLPGELAVLQEFSQRSHMLLNLPSYWTEPGHFVHLIERKSGEYILLYGWVTTLNKLGSSTKAKGNNRYE